MTATAVSAGTLSAVTLLSAMPAHAALDTTLYAVAGNVIYTLNESTGATTALPGTLPFSTNALARQPGSDLLYYYEAASPFRVGTYNVVTAATATLSGNGPGSFVRLAFRGDGQLYGMAADNDLYRLNTTTGAPTGSPTTLTGPTMSTGGDIAFLPDNNAYIVADHTLYYLPTPYTAVTSVGLTAGDGNAHPSLALGSSGRLWTASTAGANSNIGYLNLSAAAQTTVAVTSGYTFSDMASVPDRAPTASATTASTLYNTPVTKDVSSSVSDPDGDPVTVTAVTVSGGSSVGTATIDGSGRPVFSPAVGFSGSATVNYTVSDGVGGTATSTITVTVGNASPTFTTAASNTSQTVTRGSTPTALAGSDPNSGDTVTYALVSGSLPTGTTLNSDGTFAGTTTARGTFSSVVSITDNHGATTSGSLSITVPNVAPVYTSAGSNTAQTVVQGTALTALAATDAESDPLTYALTTGSLPAGVTLNSDGSFSGVPSMSGTFPVTITVTDGQGGSTATTLTIAVNAANAPTVTGDSATTTAGTATTTSVLANDTDPNAYPLSVASITQPAHGTTVLGAGGVVTYTSAAGWSGPDSYTYTAGNGHGGSATATVAVLVDPTAADDSATTAAASPVAVVVLSNDRGTLDPASMRVTVAPTHGTATVLPSGQVRYTPAFGYAGTDTFTYDVADAAANRAVAHATITTLLPASPVAAAYTSTGAGTAVQTAATVIPTGGVVTLLNGSTPVMSLVVAGQGTYELNSTTGMISFTPVANYLGSATSVTYRVTDAYGQAASSTYTPTVTAPGGPTAAAEATSGVGVTPQSTTLTAPAGNSLTLLSSDGTPATEVSVAGVGSYVLNPATGVVTFTPVLGFVGAATPVTYRITDGYGTSATATYTPQVVLGAPPVSAAAATTGPQQATQTTTVTIPNGGGVTLLGPDGRPARSVNVHGGTYTINAATGVITFEPVPGFLGTASPVTYRVTDAYGQTSQATYMATVNGMRVTPAATVAIQNLSVAGAGKSVRATCGVNIGRVAWCEVTLIAQFNGKDVLVGRGKVVVTGSGHPGPITVPITLTSQGRGLSARPGGVSVSAQAATRAVGSSVVVRATKRAYVVQPRVLVLRGVFFDTAKSDIHPGDLAYLSGLRTKLTGVVTVQCNGFTDSRDTKKYNYELGLARARAVCAVLTQGLTVRSVMVSWGEDSPHATNRSHAGMALNRRTEIVLSY